MMLTVGDHIVLTAVDLDYKGQGVCKQDGYVIFVSGLLVGEVADVVITKLNKNFGEGSINKMMKISHDRTHDTSLLGSIDLYHLNDKKQLQWQEKITKETFKKIADIDLNVTDTIFDDRQVNYRNKSVFHVMKDNRLKLGLYQKDYTLVQTPLFILADTLTNRFVNLINRLNVPIDSDVLKHVVFRTNEKQQILITFVAINEHVEGLEPLILKLSREKEVVGITLNINTNEKRILGEQSIVKYGTNEITQQLKHFEVVINDRAFFQVNWPVMRNVYEVIYQHVGTNKHVIEAYSGIGAIGYTIVDRVQSLTMIEGNEENIHMATEIIEKQYLKRITLIHANAEDVIEKHEGDVLIVDPPRNGLHKRFIEHILEMNFERIIYLSCDVKTLARDVCLLKDTYQITHAYVLRMFPQTTNIETLIIMDRIN